MEAEYLLTHLKNPRPHSCDLLPPYNSIRKNALPRANLKQPSRCRRPLPQSSSLVKLTPRLRERPPDPFNQSNNHDGSHPFGKAILSRIGGSFVQYRICSRWAVACRNGGRLIVGRGNQRRALRLRRNCLPQTGPSRLQAKSYHANDIESK